MKIITLSEYCKLDRGINSFYGKNLPLLRSGKISLLEFLAGSEKIEARARESSAICTGNYEEYKTFFKKLFPENKRDLTKHELQHAKVAVKYKLSPEFCAVIGCNYGIKVDAREGIIASNPEDAGKRYQIKRFLIDGVSEKGIGWNAGYFFKYLKDAMAAVSSMSESDAAINMLLK
jgi:hypothetical protein